VIRKILKRFGYYHFSDNKFEDINKRLNQMIMDYRCRFTSYPLKRTLLRRRLGSTIKATGFYVHIDEDNVLIKSLKIDNKKVAHHIWLSSDTSKLNYKLNGQIVELEGKVYKYFSRKNPSFEEVSMKNVTMKPKEY